MTDHPAEAAAEIARLRALLAAARLERDDLARRLAAVLDEPPAPLPGQQTLPLPLPDRPGQRPLHAATAIDDDTVRSAALQLRAADLTPQQEAAVTTLLAAAGAGASPGPGPAPAAVRGGPPRVRGEWTRRRAEQRAQLRAREWLSLTGLAARRGETDMAAVGGWVYMQLRQRALIALETPDRTIAVPAFQVTATGQPRPELRPLLEVLLGARLGGWAAWAWLTSPSSFLTGEVPEQVAASDPGRALRAATAFVTAADV